MPEFQFGLVSCLVRYLEPNEDVFSPWVYHLTKECTLPVSSLASSSTKMPPPVFRGVPLPVLTNERHYNWVFTHRSVVAIPAAVRVADSVTEDYERWANT
jgi:hypothetical protein